MKRVDLIREIERQGCVLSGTAESTRTRVSQPVPRHREIKEHLARQILRMLKDN
jgi:hypothetical protein